MSFYKVLFFTVVLTSSQAFADAQLDRGLEALKSLTGCYLVDYSYAETESLKAGYKTDERVYDVNKKQSVKEWIYMDKISSTRARIQHILFASDLDGNLIEGSQLKHQGDDWEYNAPFLYDFTGPLTWAVKDLSQTPNTWTRRVTNLDDGLRYQCAAAWSESTAYPEWTCDDYAPIPGRETRDMGRKDYNTLQRSTRIIAYGQNWLERQDNVKTIHTADGVRTPLAREVGKNWFVRLPDSECAPAKEFVKPRLAFWRLLREVWDTVLAGESTYVEKAQQPPRFAKMFEVEENYYQKNLKDKAVRNAATDEILKIIDDYRVK